jgi:hypothetical protein
LNNWVCYELNGLLVSKFFLSGKKPYRESTAYQRLPKMKYIWRYGTQR